MYIGVYVDDIILTGQNNDRIKEIRNALSSKFDIKDMGGWELHHFLGTTVLQDEVKIYVWISRLAHTENLLKKVDMQDCKPVGTPADISTKLMKATGKDKCVEQLYQSATGSLMYLSISTRPTWLYSHWTAVTLSARHCVLYSQKGSCDYHVTLLVSQMLTGLETYNDLHLVVCFKSGEVLSLGRARNRAVLLYQLLKLNSSLRCNSRISTDQPDQL